MKWLNKILGIGVLALASLTFSPKKAEACSSAKPIGRGSTNVAIADDASAAYWNPAGLVQLERPELDITVSPENRYKAFLCYGLPLNERSAVGLNLSYRNDEGVSDYKTIWLILSYSRKLSENLSVGGNLKFNRNYFDNRLLTSEEQSFYKFNIGDTMVNTDFGVLYKLNDKIKLGVLLQDCSYETIGGIVRPGVSIKLDDKTLVSFEGYDVTRSFESAREFRSGLERKINDNWSLRTGVVVKKSITPSAGISYRKGDLESSLAFVGSKNPYFVFSLNKKF